MKTPKNIPPNSMWIVVVECRFEVIRVCVSGIGFFIPGQEPCWHFSHVQEWIAQIDPKNYGYGVDELTIAADGDKIE